MDEEKLVNNDEKFLSSKTVASIYEWVEAAVFSLMCVAICFTFIFRIVGVDGSSMFPTLHDKERLIISRMFYKPDYGDIVIINRYNYEPLVKRVIAKGGDTLEINEETSEVIVNGIVLDEQYTIGITKPMEFQPNIQIIPEGYLFVMGDNRQNSTDSRDMDVGFVKEDDIMGKAEFRFFPLNRAGGLY